MKLFTAFLSDRMLRDACGFGIVCLAPSLRLQCPQTGSTEKSDITVLLKKGIK